MSQTTPTAALAAAVDAAITASHFPDASKLRPFGERHGMAALAAVLSALEPTADERLIADVIGEVGRLAIEIHRVFTVASGLPPTVGST